MRIQIPGMTTRFIPISPWGYPMAAPGEGKRIHRVPPARASLSGGRSRNREAAGTESVPRDGRVKSGERDHDKRDMEGSGNSRALIIAEAGVNHNGRLDRALELVAAAHRAGADAVKFQTFRAASLASPRAARAPYQGEGGQLEMLRRLELAPEAFELLRDRARALGIEFLSTPFDAGSVDLLRRLGVARFKVSSADVTDLPLLERIGSCGKPVILSTGMARDDEIEEALRVLARAGAPGVTLLHCITSYPAPPADLQLLRIPALRERFGLPVGYSDHSLGTDAALAARALGAVVIEKHLTLDRTLAGPDHAASAEPGELAELVERVRRLEVMLGEPGRRFSAEEETNRRAAAKSVTAAREIRAGRPLAREDLAVRRPGTGIPPRHLDELVGRLAARDIAEGEPLRWEMVEG